MSSQTIDAETQLGAYVFRPEGVSLGSLIPNATIEIGTGSGPSSFSLSRDELKTYTHHDLFTPPAIEESL